jgi:hypothetical protein
MVNIRETQGNIISDTMQQYVTTSVVQWSEFLATDPEVWVRFAAPPLLSLVSTIEELLARKSSGSGLEN